MVFCRQQIEATRQSFPSSSQHSILFFHGIPYPLCSAVQSCESLEVLKAALSSDGSAEGVPDIVAEAACREGVPEALIAALLGLDFQVGTSTPDSAPQDHALPLENIAFCSTIPVSSFPKVQGRKVLVAFPKEPQEHPHHTLRVPYPVSVVFRRLLRGTFKETAFSQV